MSSITPNMLLVVPDVSITPGPEWAQDINDSLGLIDSHDHTTNGGVKVPTGGLNINANLPFNSHAATELTLTQFETTSVTPSSITSVYVKDGELAYQDDLGQEVILTDNGSPAGASGGITGLVPPASASYSAFSKSFTFAEDVNKLAKLNISDIALYEFNNATANPIFLKSPTSVPVSYSWTFPLGLPSDRQALIVTPTGDITYASNTTMIGTVPMGGVVATFPNLTGAYNCVATTVADVATGYVLCAGQTLTDPTSAMNGQTIPNLTGSIYIRGNTTSGTTGGSNTQNLSHTHNFSHVHQVAYVDSASPTSMWSRPSGNVSTVTFTDAGSIQMVINNSLTYATGGANIASQVAFSGPFSYYSAGVSLPPSGVGGVDANTGTGLSGSTNIEPNYIQAVYVMRVL